MSGKTGAFLLLALSLLLLLTVTGCGGGAQTVQPTPQGFTNASLKGTYAFAISGQNGNGFFAVAGSFTADGSGNITGGIEDFTSAAVVATGQSVSGSYAVRTDGRTTATVTSSVATLNLDFVLLNSSTALAVRLQSTATGSGSIDLQNSSAFNLTSLAGPLAFSVAGVDLANPPNPEGTAGLVNIDASGNLTSGVMDDNDGGAVSTNLAIPAAPGAVSAPAAGTGRGTIAFVSPVTGNTLHFAYYVVDANHIKLVETDAGAIGTAFLAGDAFRQTSTTVSGSFAFTTAGATSAGDGVFTAGGILTTDGAGNITNSSVTDVNNGGTLFQAGTTTGTYSVAGGRGTTQLTGPFGTANFVFYPSSGGLLLLEIDTTVLSTGTALQQSGAPFSNSSINGAFGLNLTGVDLVNSVEVDGIAQFSSSGSGSLSGAFDFNDGGVLSNSLSMNGSYSMNTNGRGTATLSPSSLGAFHLFLYQATTSRVLFMQADTNQVTVGLFAAQ